MLDADFLPSAADFGFGTAFSIKQGTVSSQFDVGGIPVKEDHRRKNVPLRLIFFSRVPFDGLS